MKRGTASLEFALAAPVLMLLLLGGLGATLSLWVVTTLHGVAATTARCGALGLAGAPACPDEAATKAKAVAAANATLSPFVTLTAAAVRLGPAATACGTASGSFYTVTITATLPSVLTAPFGETAATVSACFPR